MQRVSISVVALAALVAAAGMYGCALAAEKPVAPAAVATAPLTCRATTKQYCDTGGCKPQPITVWNVVDLQRSTYARCDRNGCDSYTAKISRSGVYTNLEIEGRGVLAKIGEGGAFMEIVTLGTTAYVSHGRCSPDR